jgi:hypothetical protein
LCEIEVAFCGSGQKWQRTMGNWWSHISPNKTESQRICNIAISTIRKETIQKSTANNLQGATGNEHEEISDMGEAGRNQEGVVQGFPIGESRIATSIIAAATVI